MKPNLVIVQPACSGMDSIIEQFCEIFCDTHYVYLVRPYADPREDSPAGIRFLRHSLDRLPGFGCVDTAIAVADSAAACRLKECYPESKLVLWHPAENGELPDLMASLLKAKVVRGGFGEPENREFAQAM